MKRGGIWAAVLGLLILLGWVIQPDWFPGSPQSTGVSNLGGETRQLDAMKGGPQATNPKTNGIAGQEVGDLETGAGRAIPGEKILQFKDRAAYEKFITSMPAESLLGRIDGLLALRVQDGSWLKAVSSSEVASMGSNYYVAVPKVPLEVLTAGGNYYREVGKRSMEMMGAEAVTSSWGQGVKVALLDTSIENTENLKGAEAGHGTAMLSLITGSPGSVQGASPGATILGFAVLSGDGVGNSFSLAEAILKATERGAKVINMSLGSDGDSSVVRHAVAYAISKNVVLVAAAGNEAVNRVSYPAAYDGVVSVGSVDAERQHLYFSNRGPSVSVVAPGYGVEADGPPGGMVKVSGTSASTALVSGVVAALLAKEPNLSGPKVAELLRQYADDTGVAGKDDETGYGVVNLQRILERNQRGIVDLAVAGVQFDPAGKLTVVVQNRGTETVNSPVLEIEVRGDTRRFYLGSIAPGQSVGETVRFDGVRAKQDGKIAWSTAIRLPRGKDLRTDNDNARGEFKIPK